MYAARRFYVQSSDFTPEERRCSVVATCAGRPLQNLDSKRISVIEEDVMYWRKANHIHAWFVDNVQSGKDDCGTYFVSKDKLVELLSACQKVIEASKLVGGTVWAGTSWTLGSSAPVEHRIAGRVIEDPTVAKQLLPTRAGFFFGGTEYDESYLDEVKRTQAWVFKMLSDLKTATVRTDIRYSSSW